MAQAAATAVGAQPTRPPAAELALPWRWELGNLWLPEKGGRMATRSQPPRVGSRGAGPKARTKKMARPARNASSTSPRRSPKAGSAVPPLPIPREILEASVEPALVQLPARTVLAIDGAGPPDSDLFRRSLGALYGGAFGLKFARKATGTTFRIGPLEGRWWAEGAPEEMLQAPRKTWRWRLRLAVPDDVAEAELRAVVDAATSRKGGKLEGSLEARRLFVERIGPARLGRILHVGPYADEARSFERIDAFVAGAGLRPARSHLEVYFSDPRRTAPARLKTALLRELALSPGWPAPAPSPPRR